MEYTLILENGQCGGITGTKPTHKNWTLTPYLGGLLKEFWNGSEWIESATLEDVAENTIQQSLHNETQKYIQRTTDGINAYAKISAEFRLAKLSGTIDDATHTYLENLLIPVRNEVLAGQWISAKQKLIVIGVAQVGEVLYNRLFDQLSEYIEINY
jgi:hypothetical protein